MYSKLSSPSISLGVGSPSKESKAQSSRPSAPSAIRIVEPPFQTPQSTKAPGTPSRSTRSASRCSVRPRREPSIV